VRTWAATGTILGLVVLGVAPSLGRDDRPRWVSLPALLVLGAEVGWRVAATPAIGARPFGDGSMSLARELALVAFLALGFARRAESTLPARDHEPVAWLAAVATASLVAEPIVSSVAGSPASVTAALGAAAALLWMVTLAFDRGTRIASVVASCSAACALGAGLACLAASGHPILTQVLATDLSAEPGSWPRGAVDFTVVVAAFAAAVRVADRWSVGRRLALAVVATVLATIVRATPYGFVPAAWLPAVVGLVVSLGWGALEIRRNHGAVSVP